MKSKKKLCIIFFVLLLVSLSILSYFVFNNIKPRNKSINSNRIQSIKEIEPVIKNLGSLKIIIDPRIELLTAVQQQSDYQRLTHFNFKYSEDMKDYFKDYKKHKAVSIFKDLSNTGFSYDAPPTSMLYLTNPPHLEQLIDYNDNLISRAGSKKNLINLNQNLRNFCIDTNFADFYDRNIPFYKTLVDTVYKSIKDISLTQALDNYYGMEVNTYNLILAPMLHSGGYGPSVSAGNGLYDVYGIIGPSRTLEQNGILVPEFSDDTIRYLVWHEFSHSFVNPTTDKYIDEVNQYESLFSKIRSTMSSQAYPQWDICVNEHIVRAITTRLTYLYLGESAGDEALASERNHGFYYIGALCDSLVQYESNRDTYPTFESYYPELLKVFKALSEQDLPDSFFEPEFIGTINSTLNYANTLDVVIITPTNEVPNNTQKEIQLYVELIQKKFWPKAELVDDVDALERDLTNSFLVAYGTMEGNLWLNHYKDTFPFQVNEDGIFADKEYEGTNLTFITAMPNPQNYKNPMIIYTAQKSEDIVDINSIFHGPTGYIISKDKEEVRAGFYKREKEKWTFKEEE